MKARNFVLLILLTVLGFVNISAQGFKGIVPLESTCADVKRIFVDGGFGKNPIYMNLLAAAFPDKEVFAASMAQATAVGTALAIHRHWNSKPLPNDIIELKYYAVTHDAKL